MTRTVLARNGLALIAFCSLFILAPLASASAAPGASHPAPSPAAPTGSGNWPLRAQLMGQPTYLSPAMMRSLRTASLRSRQQPGNTGSGPGPGQQLPRDLDLTFIDNPGAPGNVNAVTKASLAPYTDWEPAYGPDRHTVIFSSDRPVGTSTTSTGFHLWTMQTDGSYQQQLPNTTGTDQEWPAYSADGGMIAYSARDANNVEQIHILNLGSGADSVITDSSGDKTHPTWSQNVIAFQSTERTAQNPAGLNKIWLVNYTGGARAQLTGLGSWDSTNAATSQDTEPAWEPDGVHIAFTRQIGTQTPRIFLIASPIFAPDSPQPAAAARVAQFTNFVDPKTGAPSSDKDPAWRPEGPDYQANPATNPDNDVLAFASTRKSSGNFQQFENGATSVGVTYGIYKVPIKYTDATLLNWQTESGAVVVAEDTQHPPFQYDNIHPTWTPEVTVNTITGLTEVANRIAYASNSGIPYSTSAIQYTSPRSNYDIWSSELVDLTPPSPLELPSVTPRLVAPGQPITITARFADLSSGIQHVFVQIKNPNSYLQDPSLPSLRNPVGGKDAGPFGDMFYDGHRVYEVFNYLYPHTGMPNSLRGGYQEVGYQPINPGTDSYFDGGKENLPFDLTGVFPFAFSGSPAGDFFGGIRLSNPAAFQPSDSLEMLPSTNPADPPGTFTTTWTTDPNHATDYYIDLIAVDKAGNLQDYDDIWGFSTKAFGGTGQTANHILLVNDYMSPQLFLINRGGRLIGGQFGVESWLTDNPISKFGVDLTRGQGGNVLAASLDVQLPPGNPVKESPRAAQCNDLGPGSWVDWPGGPGGVGMAFGPLKEDQFDPSQNFDGYDVWRILSRGPIPPSVLSTYGPLTVNEPSTKDVTQLTPRKVNYSCVVWSSPYTNDEYVGPGTIVDVATQQELATFMDGGGHVFLTGQDVAWALSLGDPASTAPGAKWLARYFGVDFHADSLAPDGTPINALTGPIGDRWAPTDSPIHALSFSSPSSLQSEYRTFPNYDWAGALNQEFPDTITPLAGAVGDYQQDAADQNVVSLFNGSKDMREVFAGFGLEGIDNTTRDISCSGDFQLTSENNQTILMHAIVCWLRDYKASGQVNLVEANGRLQPFPNVLVQAYVEGTNTVVASALSRSDGTYTLNGLPTGTGSGGPLTELMVTSAGYPPGSTCPLWTLRGEHGPRIVLTASRPGYSQVHSNPAVIGHGDETATANEELSVAPPGAIAGRVTDAGTGKGIAGATVTVVNKPFSDIQFTTTTDANGNYTISNVPTTPPSGPAGSAASSYIITFSAPGYQTFIVGNDPNANNKTVITVTSQGTTIVNVALVPAKGGISGKVLDPSGAPVSGAVVTATPKNLTTGLVSATTGSDGTFSFTNISPDTYTLVATKAPFSPSAPQNVVLAPGGNVTGVVLTLQTTRPGTDSISGTIRFTVQGSSPVPAPGIPVQLQDVTGVAIGSPVTTDASGQYSFTGLQDGTYKVQPVVANQTVTPRTVTLSAATGTAATGIDFTLSPIYTFPAGLTMISLPFNFSGTNVDVAQLLGLPIIGGQAAIASYDPSTNQYSLYPNLNANVPGAVGTQTLPGRGYWVKESKATAFLTGGSPITSATFDVTVLPGWNMIGDPYTGAVAWNLVQVEVPFQIGSFPANSPISMQLAQSKHIINSPLYTWNGTSYMTTTTLRPFVGYWIYVDPTASQNLPVTLTFTNPSP